MKWPRQTSPSSFYWVGEDQNITPSQIGTGYLELKARKAGGIVTLPNELLRYTHGNASAEMLVREDLSQVLALGFDEACLYGPGSATRPLGLTNTPGINNFTATDSAGAALAPTDLMGMVSAVRAANAVFEAWILHPTLFYNFVAARAAIYNGSTTTQGGNFLYSQWRELGEKILDILFGYPAVVTAQVSMTRGGTTASNGTQTSLFGGNFRDSYSAFFGAVELLNNPYGSDVFLADQTAIRGILSCDFGVRHGASISVCDPVGSSLGVP
jgi:HK97 family phage major capsid protein